MAIQIKTKSLEQLEVNGKTVTIQCGQIVNDYDLTKGELKATEEYVNRIKSLHIKSSIV